LKYPKGMRRLDFQSKSRALESTREVNAVLDRLRTRA
jgi:hypothetical protein